MSLILLPTLYVWIARDNDKLPETEEAVETGGISVCRPNWHSPVSFSDLIHTTLNSTLRWRY
jgi:hypothetical protein